MHPSPPDPRRHEGWWHGKYDEACAFSRESATRVLGELADYLDHHWWPDPALERTLLALRARHTPPARARRRAVRATGPVARVRVA